MFTSRSWSCVAMEEGNTHTIEQPCFVSLTRSETMFRFGLSFPTSFGLLSTKLYRNRTSSLSEVNGYSAWESNLRPIDWIDEFEWLIGWSTPDLTGESWIRWWRDDKFFDRPRPSILENALYNRRWIPVLLGNFRMLSLLPSTETSWTLVLSFPKNILKSLLARQLRCNVVQQFRTPCRLSPVDGTHSFWLSACALQLHDHCSATEKCVVFVDFKFI